MADAPVLGAGKRSVKLSDDAFGARFHGPLVHETVRAELNARRRGTASTKTRGLVSGGGAKPWRQKGTGRARAGSNRSPIWTGGGTVFGPQPRSYTFKINRKERRAALRSALSLHAERGSIAVVDPSAFDTPATRQAADLLGDWGQPVPTLVVLSAEEDNAALSFRNIARVSVQEVAGVGVADIVAAASLLISESALESLTARAAGTLAAASASTPAASPRPSAGRESAGASTAAPASEALDQERSSVAEAEPAAEEGADAAADTSADEGSEASAAEADGAEGEA
jgi:large subunit ribosomal protein L4